MVEKKNNIILRKVMGFMVLTWVMMAGLGLNAKAASSELAGYSKYLDQNRNNNEFKYFAIVDVNKDGVYELIGSNKQNKKTTRILNIVLYRSKKVTPYYGTSTQEILIYNKYQKGIRYGFEGTITYETLSSGGWSSVKSLSKYKEGGKTKYFYYSGDMSGEQGVSKMISKKQYNKYLKASWAFTSKSKGSTKVKFYKNTAANRNNLKNGKIK